MVTLAEGELSAEEISVAETPIVTISVRLPRGDVARLPDAIAGAIATQLGDGDATYLQLLAPEQTRVVILGPGRARARGPVNSGGEPGHHFQRRRALDTVMVADGRSPHHLA